LACERGDYALGVNPTNAVVPVGDVHVAGFIHGHPINNSKLSIDCKSAIAAEPLYSVSSEGGNLAICIYFADPSFIGDIQIPAAIDCQP